MPEQRLVASFEQYHLLLVPLRYPINSLFPLVFPVPITNGIFMWDLKRPFHWHILWRTWMRKVHPHEVDSSLCFPHSPSLRRLVFNLLNDCCPYIRWVSGVFVRCRKSVSTRFRQEMLMKKEYYKPSTYVVEHQFLRSYCFCKGACHVGCRMTSALGLFFDHPWISFCSRVNISRNIRIGSLVDKKRWRTCERDNWRGIGRITQNDQLSLWIRCFANDITYARI
jgi:hypothetical protein